MHKFTADLLEHCEAFTKELLNETKDFYPFGAFVSKAEQVHPLELEPENKNSTQNGQVVESLLKYLTNEYEAGEVIAYATVYEAQLKLAENEPEITAFAVEIINKESEEPTFYFPFEIKDNVVTYREMFAVK